MIALKWITLHCSGFESLWLYWLKRKSLGQQRSPLNVLELMKNEWIIATSIGMSCVTSPSQDMPAGKRTWETWGSIRSIQIIQSESRGEKLQHSAALLSEQRGDESRKVFIHRFRPQTTPQGSTHISRHIIFYSSLWQLMSLSLGSD